MIGVTIFGLFLTPIFYVVLEKLGLRSEAGVVSRGDRRGRRALGRTNFASNRTK